MSLLCGPLDYQPILKRLNLSSVFSHKEGCWSRKKFDYKTRLQLLNLPSLELRRLRADLLLCYKIFKGHVTGGPEAFGFSLMNRSTRGHCLKWKTEHCRVDARKFFFNAILTKPWNSLPDSVINSDFVRSFKIGLTQCNFSKFLMLGYDWFQTILHYCVFFKSMFYF